MMREVLIHFFTFHPNPHAFCPLFELKLMARLEGGIGTLVPSLDLRDIAHPTHTPSRKLVAVPENLVNDPEKPPLSTRPPPQTYPGLS